MALILSNLTVVINIKICLHDMVRKSNFVDYLSIPSKQLCRHHWKNRKKVCDRSNLSLLACQRYPHNPCSDFPLYRFTLNTSNSPCQNETVAHCQNNMSILTQWLMSPLPIVLIYDIPDMMTHSLGPQVCTFPMAAPHWPSLCNNDSSQ